MMRKLLSARCSTTCDTQSAVNQADTHKFMAALNEKCKSGLEKAWFTVQRKDNL